MEKKLLLSEVPPVPEGAAFKLVKLEKVPMPHPYCVTGKHVAIASDEFSGILSEAAIRAAETRGVWCDICVKQVETGKRRQPLSHAEHESPLTLFVAVPQSDDLNAVPGLVTYLNAVKAANLGVEGFAFPRLDAPPPPTEPGVVAGSGMGGFLNPPGHPEHTHHVATDLQKRPENRSGMSLSVAVECDWLSPTARADAKRMLDEWQANRPALDSPEVKDWVHKVLGYFRVSYRGEGPEPECWHVANLIFLKAGDAARPNEEHAGVHLIRKYYPEYSPTAEDFAGAYWGKKPVKVG